MEISPENSFVVLLLVIGLIAMFDCALRCCEHDELHKERNITMDVIFAYKVSDNFFFGGGGAGECSDNNIMQVPKSLENFGNSALV